MMRLRLLSILLLWLLMTLASANNLPAHEDIRVVLNVEGMDPGPTWVDSYSVGDECYCDLSLDTTFDHGIGDFYVETPLGWMTIRQVCELLGPGPGAEGRPIYNDVQCGNGPPNDAGDEHKCPGRVDLGIEGCGHIGPKWKFPTESAPFVKVSFGFGPVDGYEAASQSNIIGTVSYFAGSKIEIGGTSLDQAYASHAWSTADFGYKLKVDPYKKYKVKVGLAESYKGACNDKGRIFNLEVGENRAAYDVNTFLLSGCEEAHDLIFRQVQPKVLPSGEGELTIMAKKGSAENPFMALLEVSYESDNTPVTKPTPVATPQPTNFPTMEPTPQPTNPSTNPTEPDALPLRINFGSYSSIDGYDKPRSDRFIGTNIIDYNPTMVEIHGTTADQAYKSHSWSHKSFGYRVFVDDASKRYKVKIGLAEAFIGNCHPQKRRFNLRAGDKFMGDVDVFERVGCQTAYNVVFTNVRPTEKGELNIEALKGSADNPMMSLIEVSLDDSSTSKYRPLPIKISFGPDEALEGYDVVDESRLSGITNPSVGQGESIGGTTADASYRSNLWSRDKVAYAIDKLDPNKKYTVKLGFAETFPNNCSRGKRVFDVQVGTTLKRNIDVYVGAGERCFWAYDIYFYDVQPIEGLIPVMARDGAADNPFISVLEVYEA